MSSKNWMTAVILAVVLFDQLSVARGTDAATTQFVTSPSLHDGDAVLHIPTWVGAGGLATFKVAMSEFYSAMLARWTSLNFLGARDQLATLEPLPDVPLGDDWESRFLWGMYYSKTALEIEDFTLGTWAPDTLGSGSGVPKQFLLAEELLRAVEDAPADKKKSKGAERALRVYYHAKWLAERQFSRAAESRYWEAHRLARETGRKVLAAHSLSRLGYFLITWCRHSEARDVLRESERLSVKTNPLAPYLLGVLERQTAGADIARLHAAEERILNSETQPSEDLERERQVLIQEIKYWRSAELSPRNCWETPHASHALICLGGHLSVFVRKSIFAEA